MQSRKHIHLIGICGTAMASLAGMLQAQGHHVTGSDAAAYPPMSDQLAARKITVMEPYSEKNLQPAPDLVVVGNAISRGNPELEYVLDQRICFVSMAALIHDEFLQQREPVVVCGTHGKTTTTSMLAWIYEVASSMQPEFAPSFLIGGVAENFATSFLVRDTKPFLLEGDEYDTAFFDKGPKFLHYFPDAAILTHVEYDHADIYADLAAVKTAFKRLVNLVPRRGRIVAFDGSANVTECVAKAFCGVERYGFEASSHWQMKDFSGGAHCRWTLLRAGQHFGDLELSMAGEHNALNATAAAAMAAGQGIRIEAITEALRTFKSVKRRLEVRAEVNGITIIDDFAHHPTAIRETLRAVGPDGVTLVGIGPATNLALALATEPALAASVAEIVLMTGAVTEGNITPAAEFNAFCDPEALAVLLGFGRPVTLATLDVTNQALCTPARIASLRAANGGSCAGATVDIWQRVRPSARSDFAGHEQHDPCALAWLVAPGLFTSRDVWATVDLGPGPERGRTVFGVGAEPNARLLETVDAEGFFALLTERLPRLP